MQNKMDFTLSAYKQLISTLQFQGYFFQTLQDFIQKPKDKTVILRHDVDRKPGNALIIAKIEREVGIRASYYFRIVKESYDEDVIRQIAEMGHEIGYHYENLSEISKKNPQITPVRFSEPTGQAQVDADYLISHQTPLCELRTAGRPTPNSALRAMQGRPNSALRATHGRQTGLRMKLRPGKPTRTFVRRTPVK